MSALTAEGLNTYYGKSHILHDVGLTVAEGQITTLLGQEWCRQVHHAAQPGRPDPAALRPSQRCSARTSPVCRRTASPPPALVSFPKAAASSPT